MTAAATAGAASTSCPDRADVEDQAAEQRRYRQQRKRRKDTRAMTTNTPAADDPEIARRLADLAAAQRRRLATSGVAGRIDPSSRVEALQERRDRDRARWLGVHTFDRPPTPAEKALILPVTDENTARQVQTRVDLRGGLYRRCWPALLPRGGAS